MTVISNVSSYWGEFKGPSDYLEFFENNQNNRLSASQFAQFTITKMNIETNPFMEENLILSPIQLSILQQIIQNPSNDEYEDYRLICFNLSSDQLDFIGW